MARGGRRGGSRGTAYPNRTDLQTALPQTAPTGLEYGERSKLIAAQRTIPMAPAPLPATGSPPAGSVSQPSPAGGPSPFTTPGANPLLAPTNRPSEPVTAGLPTGPGPGPEALGPLAQPNQGSTVASLLSSLAASPNATPEIQQLATYSRSGK